MKVYYCKKCQKETPFEREKMNIGVIIVLAIFTGGVGIPFYIWAHHSNHKKMCIYCGTPRFSPIETSTPSSETPKSSVMHISGNKVKYCDFCGNSIESENTTYCPECGEKL
ncbi:MAG: hypothetical protein KGD63_08345 [Candidatus Lokiarchaeota archaeon]|nr:hypothetical protein [Candidatus Lokiarchaeota archaeon]